MSLLSKSGIVYAQARAAGWPESRYDQAETRTREKVDSKMPAAEVRAKEYVVVLVMWMEIHIPTRSFPFDNPLYNDYLFLKYRVESLTSGTSKRDQEIASLKRDVVKQQSTIKDQKESLELYYSATRAGFKADSAPLKPSADGDGEVDVDEELKSAPTSLKLVQIMQSGHKAEVLVLQRKEEKEILRLITKHQRVVSELEQNLDVKREAEMSSLKQQLGLLGNAATVKTNDQLYTSELQIKQLRSLIAGREKALGVWQRKCDTVAATGSNQSQEIISLTKDNESLRARLANASATVQHTLQKDTKIRELEETIDDLRKSSPAWEQLKDLDPSWKELSPSKIKAARVEADGKAREMRALEKEENEPLSRVRKSDEIEIAAAERKLAEAAYGQSSVKENKRRVAKDSELTKRMQQEKDEQLEREHELSLQRVCDMSRAMESTRNNLTPAKNEKLIPQTTTPAKSLANSSAKLETGRRQREKEEHPDFQKQPTVKGIVKFFENR